MSGGLPKKPGPEPDTLKLDGPWEDRIGEALKKRRPYAGFPKPPERVTPRRVPPPPKPEKGRRVPPPPPAPPDPLDVAEMRAKAASARAAARAKPSKAAVQDEMLRAHCTRSQAIANIKARKRRS